MVYEPSLRNERAGQTTEFALTSAAMTLNISTLTPPAWTEPGAQPELLQLADGRILFTWARTVSDAVWIVCEDDVDPIVAGPTRVHVAETASRRTPRASWPPR